MSRNLTATMLAESGASVIEPVFLMQFDFDLSTQRYWTGIGTLTWNSLSWFGSGDVIKITGFVETQRVEATGIQFQLAGADSNLISLALDEDVQGRPCSVWLGFISQGTAQLLDESGDPLLTEDGDSILLEGDAAGVVLENPIGPFVYRMDSLLIDDTPGQNPITLTAESYLASLGRARVRRLTHEDQQIEFPGDLGLEFVTSIQNKEIKWGRA